MNDNRRGEYALYFRQVSCEQLVTLPPAWQARLVPANGVCSPAVAAAASDINKFIDAVQLRGAAGGCAEGTGCAADDGELEGTGCAAHGELAADC